MLHRDRVFSTQSRENNLFSHPADKLFNPFCTTRQIFLYLRAVKFNFYMPDKHEIFNRTERLIGSDAMLSLTQKRVIIFGIGGVGSWCAESLIRSGMQHLTIVDSDCVCASNVNRQAMATTATIGQVKVEAMKEKLLTISPEADITAIRSIYSSETREQFGLEAYDYVVDAIDSLEHKAELILHATSLPRDVKFFSSMGAALKMDPTQIRVDEFWNVKGCPLARALRQRFKRAHRFPARKFRVVYSPEVLPNLGRALEEQPDAQPADTWTPLKAQVNGSLAHITAIFGFTLAGLILQDMTLRAHDA